MLSLRSWQGTIGLVNGDMLKSTPSKRRTLEFSRSISKSGLKNPKMDGATYS